MRWQRGKNSFMRGQNRHLRSAIGWAGRARSKKAKRGRAAVFQPAFTEAPITFANLSFFGVLSPFRRSLPPEYRTANVSLYVCIQDSDRVHRPLRRGTCELVCGGAWFMILAENKGLWRWPLLPLLKQSSMLGSQDLKVTSTNLVYLVPLTYVFKLARYLDRLGQTRQASDATARG